MSAKQYYQAPTEQPNIPQNTHPNQQTSVRGFPPQQGQYYPPQPPYQQQYYPYQGQQQQHPQQPVYVQQAPPQRGNNDCLTACLATMCLCCTLDMLF